MREEEPEREGDRDGGGSVRKKAAGEWLIKNHNEKQWDRERKGVVRCLQSGQNQ